MRGFSEDFYIDGKPMLLPDEQVRFAYEDLDSAASGRDESGFMHRFVARCKVGSWEFSYSHLTESERIYMESLFSEAATFTFTHPDRVTGQPVNSHCYRSKYSLSWKNARTGLWNSYGFHIIQC